VVRKKIHMDEKTPVSKKEIRIPVVAEQVEADAKQVVTGRVRVNKTVHSRDEVIEQPLHREDVDVRRVIKNEIVDGPIPIRYSGDTTIVPVVKEVLKIEKQWVLTEEIHIVKRRSQETSAQTVRLLEEQATIERVDADGGVHAVEPLNEARPNIQPVRQTAARPAVSDQPFTDRLRARSRAMKPKKFLK